MNNKKSLMLTVLFTLLILANLTDVNAFELTATELTKDVCPSQTAVFSATISGAGNFNLNLEGSASAFATVIPQSISLNNEAKTIFIYVTPSINVNPGKYNLNLIAASGAEVKNINYEVNVINCFNIGITGPSSKELCACNSEQYEFNIINNGIYQETYQVEVKGAAAQWVSLSQNKITLNAGQSTKVLATLTAPCNIAGRNDFNIIVRSLTTNAVASFSSAAEVVSCFEFDAKLSKDFINFCERTIETIPITTTNLANEENEFSLKLTGPAWANLELNKLKLNANAKQNVNLILSPDYGVKGDFDINVKIESSQGKIKKDLALKTTVRKCHDVLLEILETQDKICSTSTKNYEISVKNLGEFEKEFKLETNQEWVKLSQNSITINKDEVKKVNLEVSPGNVTAGVYNLNIKATALDTSKVISQDSLSLEVVSSQACYKASLAGLNAELNADTTSTVPITITNTGIETVTYLLGVSGNAANFIRLNPASLELKPGKSEIIYLYIAPPFNTIPDTYKATIFAKLADTGILDSETIDIKVNAPGKPVEVKETFLDRLFVKIRDWFKSIKLDFGVNLTKISEVTEEVKPEVKENITIIKEKEVPKELAEISLENKTIIKESVKFNFKGEHTIKIKEIHSKDVVIEINSNPKFLILDINETEEVDLNDDGKNDITLTLKSLKNNIPEIEINKLEEKESLFLTQFKDYLSKYRYWIIGIIIIIIILILLFATNAFNKLFGFFREKVEEEEEAGEPLKIGRYVLLLIIIIILIWLFRKYPSYWKSLISFITPYKTFIIAGIIILILLILVINYWKQILDFFEEEPRKRK